MSFWLCLCCFASCSASFVPLAVSQLLKDQLRWADLVGQTKTLEFVLVLPETTKEDAETIASKINEAVNELTVTGENGDEVELIPLFGVTEWTKGDDTRSLLKRAGNALGTAAAETGKQVQIA